MTEGQATRKIAPNSKCPSGHKRFLTEDDLSSHIHFSDKYVLGDMGHWT